MPSMTRWRAAGIVTNTLLGKTVTREHEMTRSVLHYRRSRLGPDKASTSWLVKSAECCSPMETEARLAMGLPCCTAVKREEPSQNRYTDRHGRLGLEGAAQDGTRPQQAVPLCTAVVTISFEEKERRVVMARPVHTRAAT